MNILHGICLAMLGLIVASGMATAGGGPMADAGLDQSVPVDTTVQLDATGSTHPEGDIESYEWRIETPGGREIAPDCTACARTTFTPNTTGQYEVTVTVTGSAGATASDTLYVDVEGAPAPSPDPPETGQESTGDTTAEPIETEYTVQNPVSGCINDVSGEAVTRYVRASDVENCDTDDGWVQPEQRQEAEVTVELDRYEKEGSLSLGDLPTPEIPDPIPPKGSGGMGRLGETNVLVSDAREAQQGETGPMEGILYGADSAEVTTYETTSSGAQALANADRVASRDYQPGQGNGELHGWNDATQTAGPTGATLDHADEVEVTVQTAEGSGLLDTLGVADTYSREEYERDRSALSDVTDSFTDGVSNMVEGTGNLPGSVDGSSDESTPTAINTDTPESMASGDDGLESDWSLGSDFNDGSAQDDSPDSDVGYSTGSSSSDLSSDSSDDRSEDLPSGTDLELPRRSRRFK
jgi:hypothetical protein